MLKFVPMDRLLSNRLGILGVLVAAGSIISTAAFAADRKIKVDDRLDASADTLTDMMRASDQGIPQDLIDKAHCVVVMPGMKKAGFIFGAEYGRGFAVCRRHGGAGWSAPAAMRVGRWKFRISDWRFGHRCCVARDERWRNEAPVIR